MLVRVRYAPLNSYDCLCGQCFSSPRSLLFNIVQQDNMDEVDMIHGVDVNGH